MDESADKPLFVFPRWANYALPGIVIAVLGAGLYIPTFMAFGFSPRTTDIGFQPNQPIPFSHALHAGELGLDCRYCHTTVETAGFAAVPATQTCMNCHATIKTQSPNLEPLRLSWHEGTSVPWTKVHDLPDYAYFNHAAHINQGVGCVTCHGRIDQMETVHQVRTLSMSWCLDCHREPERFLRPKDQVTNMNYAPPGNDQLRLGEQLKKAYGIRDANYMMSCSTCHR